MQKNDTFKIVITGITEDGDGIGRIPGDGRVVFCKGALAGETVSVQIIKVTKDYAVARVNEILDKSPDRAEPDCSHTGRCGGCSFRHCSYPAQLKIKQQYVRDCIERIGGFTDNNIEFLPIIGMNTPYNYRNKAIFPFSTDKNGSTVSGFYRKNSHAVIEIDNCKIENSMASQIRLTVNEFANNYNLPAYNEETGTGLIRNLMIRTSRSQNEAMAVLVINGMSLPNADEFISYLTEKCPFVGSVYLNLNTQSGNKVVSDKFVHLYGKEKLRDSILDTWFDISPMSFYQINPEQTDRLYSAVIDFADIRGSENILDIYCGIGTIGLCLANCAQKAGTPIKSLTGIEYIRQAVIDAEHNATLNGITNAAFYDGDAGKVLATLSEKGLLAPKYDLVILDPPRKGCDKKLLDTAVSVNPEKIIYVSCNAATLARDLKYLREIGYEPQKVQPVDMFPYTGHVETVALLSRQKVDEHIYLDVNVQDLPKTTRTTATYPEIKAYIKDKYGLNVTSLNIAQIKEKHGFEKRENYNKGKEGHRVPNCPPEKEKAIEDAFKHFGML